MINANDPRLDTLHTEAAEAGDLEMVATVERAWDGDEAALWACEDALAEAKAANV